MQMQRNILEAIVNYKRMDEKRGSFQKKVTH
jgi:hypothetical protein